MAKNEAARADGQFLVISQTPDVCKTPPAATPVPYPIVGILQDKFGESPNVRFRGKPAKTMKSRVTRVMGNEAGAMGGVKSAVNVGFCKPITHSPTVRVNGSHVLYDKDTLYEMNCAGPGGSGNTVGKLVFCGASMPASMGPEGPAFADPEIVAEIDAEAGFLDSIASVDGIAGLAKMAPQLATMDWSNPAAALGAFGGLAGLGGFTGLGTAAGMVSQAGSLLQGGGAGGAAGLLTSVLGNGGSILGAAGNLAGSTGCFPGSKVERAGAGGGWAG